MRLLLIFMLTFVFAAQDTLTYEWDDAGLTLHYPAGWEAPFPTEIGGEISLQMAEVLADTPLEIRPPAIPTILLTLSSGNQDMITLLQTSLELIGVEQLDAPGQVEFLGSTVPQLTGTNADGQIFGIVQAAALNDSQILIATGRSISEQQDRFSTLFQQVTASIQVSGAAQSSDSAYGVLWHMQRSIEDGDEAFFDLVGLAPGPQNTLFSYEADLGLLQIDNTRGKVLSIYGNPNLTSPSDIAAGPDGTVYVADSACGCIFTLTPEGTWLDLPFGAGVETEFGTGLITGFGRGAPAQLAVGPDNRLYATDVGEDGLILIRSFGADGSERQYALDDTVVEQPLLSTGPDGSVLALTQDGRLLEISLVRAGEIDSLDIGATEIRDFVRLPDGAYLFATLDQGILMLDAAGDFIAQVGTLVAEFPLPGEFVAPGALWVEDETHFYVADSDGSFGAITAMSSTVSADRLGATALIPGLGVQGILDAQTRQQIWTYDADAGPEITLTALDNSGSASLDLALRLIAPDGSEIAYNDNHTSLDIFSETDAQIANVRLPVAGEYSVIVEQVEGQGAYTLGLVETQVFSLESPGAVLLEGDLNPVFPVESWTFEGRAGQRLTLTLEASSGNLDPALRVFGPAGELLAENDDADDPSLGFSAQLVDLELPSEGHYRIDAAAFNGLGRYQLRVEMLTE